MHVREQKTNPVMHLALVSALVLLAFLACEGLHILEPAHDDLHLRPEVHMVFLPHGMFVLLAWVYGWAMVPLVLPSLLVAAAFIVGPEFMTPTVALLAVARLVLVMATMEGLRALGRDARGDHGRRGLLALVTAGVISSLGFNALRVVYGACCEVMSTSDRVLAYVTAVGADVVGMMVVMFTAMLLFRLMRH